MKNKMIAAIICLSTFAVMQSSFAQEMSDTNFFKKITTAATTAPSENSVSFGIRTGLNFAKFHEEDDNGNGNRTTFNIGGIVDIPLAGNLYIQPGLYITGKGNKYENGESYSNFNLTYLEVSVLLSYRVANVWYLNFGPYLAYGIAGKMKNSHDEFDAFGDGSDNIGLNRFDCGFSYGTGFQLSKFYIGIQYDLGLINILNSDVWDDDYNVKTRCLSINIGYNF